MCWIHLGGSDSPALQRGKTEGERVYSLKSVRSRASAAHEALWPSVCKLHVCSGSSKRSLTAVLAVREMVPARAGLSSALRDSYAKGTRFDTRDLCDHLMRLGGNSAMYAVD
jgi:hypothetical protein